MSAESISRDLSNLRAILRRRDELPGIVAQQRSGVDIGSGGEGRNSAATDRAIEHHLSTIGGLLRDGRMTASQGERFLYLERWAIKGREYADDHARRIAAIDESLRMNSHQTRYATTIRDYARPVEVMTIEPVGPRDWSRSLQTIDGATVLLDLRYGLPSLTIFDDRGRGMPSGRELEIALRVKDALADRWPACRITIRMPGEISGPDDDPIMADVVARALALHLSGLEA